MTNDKMREKFSYTDHALLRMNDPTNLMVITGLMTFDAPLNYDDLKNTIERNLLPIRRFRQRVVPSRTLSTLPEWEDAPNFDIDSHIGRIELPQPADQKALLAFVGTLLGTDIDTSRPPWQFYLIENYETGSALIARIHHSIADGVALMQVLLSMTDSSAAPSSQLHTGAHAEQQISPEPVKTHKSAFLKLGRWTPRNLWEEGKKMAENPGHTRFRVRQVIGLAASLSRLALMWPDPPTVYNGSLGEEKRAAISEPVALQDVKFIRKTFNSTVNDVMLTALAGALGRYIEFRGDDAGDLMIRGFIPVNLRPAKNGGDLGNKFGLVFHSMPIGIKDPIERLRAVKKDMDTLKSSSEAFATFGAISIFGAVPFQIEQSLIDFFDSKGSAVITNVPGPQTQRYLAGAPINTVMAWVPKSGKIGLGISIISYNGKIWLGVATDKDLVPDPEVIATYFEDELKDLLSRAEKVQAARQKYTQPMSNMLDQAIQTLDDLLNQNGKR